MTDSSSRWMRWSEPGWRSTTLAVVLEAVGAGLFPRLTRWMRWPRGLSPRGRLIYAAVTAAVMFGGGELARRARQWRERIVAELRDELGREPTPDEIEHRVKSNLARGALEEELGREPSGQELRDFLAAR